MTRTDPAEEALAYFGTVLEASPSAKARWAAYGDRERQPLLIWLLRARTGRGRRRRAREAVEQLSRPDLGVPRVGAADLLFPPVAGASWLDALLRR